MNGRSHPNMKIVFYEVPPHQGLSEARRGRKVSCNFFKSLIRRGRRIHRYRGMGASTLIIVNEGRNFQGKSLWKLRNSSWGLTHFVLFVPAAQVSLSIAITSEGLREFL